MPFINAVLDSRDGNRGREDGQFYPYRRLRADSIAGGFLFDRMARCYGADWGARNFQLRHLRLNATGHSPAEVQEMLLFPPPYGMAGVPQACVVCFYGSQKGRGWGALARNNTPHAQHALTPSLRRVFNHLTLLVTQSRGGVLNAPPVEVAAVATALSSFGV